jgi:hypothetical protein
LGMTVGSGRGDVVDIIGVFALRAKFSAIPILPLTYRQCTVLQLPHNCNTSMEERWRGEDSMQCVCSPFIIQVISYICIPHAPFS